jgi:predicted ATPase
LLTSGRRTALPRHRTLRAALDWSYELLPELQQRLLRRLAVFPAEFTLESASAVVADFDDSELPIVEGIADLVAKSLVAMAGTASSGRWRLLETIRAYALEKLARSSETDQVARRHAEYFRDLIAAIAPGLRSPSAEDMNDFGQEISNVRSALDWAFSTGGDRMTGAVFTAAYAPVWLYLESVAECRERTEHALKCIGDDGDQRLRCTCTPILGSRCCSPWARSTGRRTS